MAHLVNRTPQLFLPPKSHPVVSLDSQPLILPNYIIHDNPQLIHLPHNTLHINMHHIFAIRHQKDSQLLQHPDVVIGFTGLNDLVQIVLFVLLQL